MAAAADNAEVGINNSFAILNADCAHGAAASTFATADAGIFIYCHSKWSGQQLTDIMQKRAYCSYRAKEIAVTAAAFSKQT